MTRTTGVFYRNAMPGPLGTIGFAGYHFDLPRMRTTEMRTPYCYVLVYVLKGRARFESVNGVHQTLGPGDLFFLFPKLPFRYLNPPEIPWSEFYIGFDGPIFDLWRQRRVLDESRPVHHVEPIEYWLRRFEQVVAPTKEPAREPILPRVCRLQDALAEALTHEQERGAAREDRDWLIGARALIDGRSGHTPVDWDAISSRMNLSWERFRKKFAELAGISPGKYRATRIMEHAAERLLKTDHPLKQIADACGFCNEFHFSRRFKQTFGLSPREFRGTRPAGKSAR